MIDLRITRRLKTKDIEWFWVGNNEINFQCDLLFVDTHRSSTLDDFSHLKDFIEKKFPETKSDYEYPNLVKAIYFFRGKKPNDEIMEELGFIVEELLSHLVYQPAEQHNIIKVFDKSKFIDLDSDELNIKEIEYYYDFIDNYLIKNYGFTNKSLNRFKNPTFHFLTQEKTWPKEMEKKYKIRFSK